MTPGARGRVAPRSDDLDAGEVLLAAAQHEPRRRRSGRRRPAQVGVLDALVVEVGAALADGASGLALALHQPGVDEQVDDAGQLAGRDRRTLRPRAGRRPAWRAELAAGRPRRTARRRRPWPARSPRRRAPASVTSSARRFCPARRNGFSARLRLEVLDLLAGEEGEDPQQLADLLVLDVEPELVEGVRRHHLGVEPERTALGLAVLGAVGLGHQRRGEGVRLPAVGAADQLDARR